tara:strand:- start:1174 stop:1362 length:189 start_codon:yes stop_codon:yes gene_type:complete
MAQTKSNGIDLGELQKRFQNAKAQVTRTSNALKKAQDAFTKAKNEMAEVSDEFEQAYRGVTS